MNEEQKVVDRVHQILCVLENLGQELQEAQEENKILNKENKRLCAANNRQAAEIARLREALEFLEPLARELLEVAAVETAAYRRRWHRAIEQASAVVEALDAFKETADD